MSGGQKINDRSFWAGKGNKDSVFPMGCKFKSESSAEGAGAVSMYQDTTEAIKASQVEGSSKIKRHANKPNYRE